MSIKLFAVLFFLLVLLPAPAGQAEHLTREQADKTVAVDAQAH